MTSDVQPGTGIVGTLRSADGRGVVRIEDRFATDIDDLWSSLTDPRRLARWLGEFEGELRVGGEFRAHFLATGWEGTGHVDECEPPHRFRTTSREEGSDELVREVWLTADGDHTILVMEERGMPLDHVADYGAGNQIHIEDLEDYLAGLQRREDVSARWQQLRPGYEQLAAGLDQR